MLNLNFKRHKRLLSGVAIAVVFMSVLGVSSFAQTNLLYINANTGLCPGCQPGKNQVLAYALNTNNGQLTKVGGPFFTRGTGVYHDVPGNETDADQQLIINRDGTLLFAVNGNSNTIAVFNINPDGSLTSVPGSPFFSNGPEPASLGLLEDPNIGGGNSILVVANKDNDPMQPATNPNWSTFLVNPAGNMRLNPNATIVLPQGSSPSQALIDPASDLMLGMLFIGSGQGSITSYRVKSNGTMAPINTVLTPNNGKFFLGEIKNPQTSAVYAGLPDQSLVGVYRVNSSTGTLTFNKTVSDPGQLPCWVAINKAGTRLYVVETMSSSVTVYQTSNSLNPVQLQHINLAPGGSFGATNVALDPTEKFLFVLTGTTLHTLNVQSDGTLAETIQGRLLPLPAGTVPTGMATLLK